jgi:hypothetical protein
LLLMSKIIAGIVRKNIRKNMAETNPVGAKKI